MSNHLLKLLDNLKMQPLKLQMKFQKNFAQYLVLVMPLLGPLSLANVVKRLEAANLVPHQAIVNLKLNL